MKEMLRQALAVKERVHLTCSIGLGILVSSGSAVFVSLTLRSPFLKRQISWSANQRRFLGLRLSSVVFLTNFVSTIPHTHMNWRAVKGLLDKKLNRSRPGLTVKR